MEQLSAFGAAALNWVKTAPLGYASWWLQEYTDNPTHLGIELALVVFILYVLFVKKPYNAEIKGYGARDPEELTEEEIDQLVEEWQPEPLVPAVKDATAEHAWEERVVIEKVLSAKEVVLQGEQEAKLNLTSNDFLNFGSDEGAREDARKVLDEYSCGSCGPRGFYGTTEKHAELEQEIARVMNAEEAIIYSDAVSCVASVIPAFAKRGDLLIMDSAVNHAIQTGANLSRASIQFFKHNDMADLERAIVAAVKKYKKFASTQRRFVVVEGLYKNLGDVAPMADIVRLKDQYGFRVICDESLSWGVLGATGKGIVEHCGLPGGCVEITIGSLATTLGGVGGFCVGSRDVIDHQRLSGSGYCFSASAPPFTCAAATRTLRAMTPEMFANLKEKSKSLHEAMQGVEGVQVVSFAESPVVHARLAVGADVSKDEQEAMCVKIIQKCRERGVLITRDRYVSNDTQAQLPSLRLHANALLTERDIAQATEAVQESVAEVLGLSVSRSSSAAAGSQSVRRSNRARQSSSRK